MGDRTFDGKESGVLLKVLTAHYNALVSAGSDETVLKQYATLLRFLKSRGTHFLENPASSKHSDTYRPRALPTISDNTLRSASLNDLEKLISDEGTSRIDLEYIAIQRFSVPRGSMRSFSNKQMLVDKLRTLVGNERTHETIGAVARGEVKNSSDS
jgi:hypothetical protein